jgi:hypothetical protein
MSAEYPTREEPPEVLASSGDVGNVPAQLILLAWLFVWLKVFHEDATTAGMDLDLTRLLAAIQEANSTRAERFYRNALKEA